MIIQSLRLLSFRAHAESRLSFTPKVNLLYGPNGAGKTNVLEAIHYLCLTKSFLATQDAYALRKDAPFFEVEGVFEGERRPELKVRLVYMPDEGKRIFVNGAPLDRLADMVGMVPVVVFSPEDQALTAGGPDERRRFLNNILSQARPVYMDDLLKYRRALRQRNELLAQYRRRRGGPPPEVLDSWSAEVVELGTRVVAARHRFIQDFSIFLDRAYGQVEQVAERPTIRYATIAPLKPGDDEARIREKYWAQLERVAARERERGVTLLGPHRDELVFRLNDFEVRRYASQGQHRTFGMALKIAKYFYLHDRLEEYPILLLDDVFDHLDAQRAAAFLALIQTDAVGQTVITATQRNTFALQVPFARPEHQTVHVAAGGVVGAGEGGHPAADPPGAAAEL